MTFGMKLADEWRAGKCEGEDKKELELFLNLRETTNWSDEQVLIALKIPGNRREALLKRAHQ